MGIDKLSSVAGAVQPPAPEAGKEKFSRTMGEAQRASAPSGEMAPVAIQPGHVAAHGRVASAPAPRITARLEPVRQIAHGIDRVQQAQRRLEHVLHLAESGRTFTPAELLALQAQVYQASNQIDLAGKVVDKATGGVKQILQTQV
jgi:hypothetical protein